MKQDNGIHMGVLTYKDDTDPQQPRLSGQHITLDPNGPLAPPRMNARGEIVMGRNHGRFMLSQQPEILQQLRDFEQRKRAKKNS